MDVSFMFMGLIAALLALLALVISFPATCVMAALAALCFILALVARAKGWD